MTKPDKAVAPPRDQAAQSADKLAVTAHASGPLVINLCSSNTPMTLVRPDAPELARFTFFVSRRREEGRERFRLHMGYFETRAEAEQLLMVVREVYPAAWVGDAPGQNLRPEARSAKPAATPPAAPAAAAQPAASAAAPVAAPAAPAAAVVPAAAKPRVSQPAAPATPRAPAAAPAPALAPAPSLVSMRAAPAAVPAAPAALQQSNVREVLAQLDGAAPVARTTSPAPRDSSPRAPARGDAEPRPDATRAPAQTPAARSAPATPAARPPVAVPTREELEYELLHGGAEASDSQVLRVLENRVAPESSTPSARRADALPREAREIPVQRPQDTMTWREIRQEIAREANVSFALQLVWSPNPIEPGSVPPLAIFDAYTLYNVEVTRPNAKQYGLRLGFFSDAMSAKQVAAYVRSEFLSVAVVPVTLSERDQAQKSGGIQLARTVATPGNSMQAEEITLINELTPPRQRAAAPSAAAAAAAKPEVSPNKPAAATAPGAKPARPSRPRGGGPRTLEETLEILGASQLSIDNGKGERLNLGGRGRASTDKRSSTFSKLLDRLSTRLKP